MFISEMFYGECVILVFFVILWG